MKGSIAGWGLAHLPAGIKTWHRHLLGLISSQVIRSSVFSPAPASTSQHTPISQPCIPHNVHSSLILFS